MRNYKCSICGNVFEGYGNNPFPYRKEGECCDSCNLNFVIPERLKNSRIDYSDNPFKTIEVKTSDISDKIKEEKND